MKTIVLTIDYTDSTDKFWFESCIKNKIIKYDDTKKSVHEAIAEQCEEEGLTLSYKAKPMGNIYRDKKDGSYKIVGYMYRGCTTIHDRDMPKPAKALFDVWATIYGELNEFKFEEIN